MKPRKIDITMLINPQQERKLEDWQFLLAAGIKAGSIYQLLQMLRKENGLQSKSKLNQKP